jgi:hypothetical protein
VLDVTFRTVQVPQIVRVVEFVMAMPWVDLRVKTAVLDGWVLLAMIPAHTAHKCRWTVVFVFARLDGVVTGATLNAVEMDSFRTVVAVATLLKLEILGEVLFVVSLHALVLMEIAMDMDFATLVYNLAFVILNGLALTVVFLLVLAHLPVTDPFMAFVMEQINFVIVEPTTRGWHASFLVFLDHS